MSIYSFFKNRRATKELNVIRDRVGSALDKNKGLLTKSEDVRRELSDDFPELPELKKMIEFCEGVEKRLQQSRDGIERDFFLEKNRGGDISSLVNKYKKEVTYIEGLKNKYPLNETELSQLCERNKDSSLFIESLFKFANVECDRIEENGTLTNIWEYNTDKIQKCTWEYNEESGCVSIEAWPKQVIMFNGSGSDSIGERSKSPEDGCKVLFEDKQLVLSRVCKLSFMDHYDVSEYFDYVLRLINKQIVVIVGKSLGKKDKLSEENAKKLVDDTNEKLKKLKQITPPPIDYVQDVDKLPDGKQRWAQLADLNNDYLNLLKPEGFIIGKLGYGSYIYTGEYNSHLLTIASVGSGKGVGVIIPNLLRHKGSAVILDPKGENFVVTGKKRQELGNKVYYYDPWDVIDKYIDKDKITYATKATINPLDFISPDDEDFVDEARALASCLMVRTDPNGDFFYNGADNFITRLIVYVCSRYPMKKDDPDYNKRNFIEVRNLIMKPPKELLKELEKYRDVYVEDKTIHPSVADLISWLNSMDSTKAISYADIYSFATQATEFLSNPSLQKSFKESNFDINEIKQEPTSLYLVFDMRRLLYTMDVYKPMIRLILTICMKAASALLQQKSNNTTQEASPQSQDGTTGEGANEVSPQAQGGTDDKLLFMLDEIAQLGNFQYLPNFLSIVRSSGVVVWTIWQNLAQIKANYDEEWQTIVGNCDVQQYFGVNDDEMAKRVSERIGKTTIFKESHTIGGTSTKGESVSESRGSSHGVGKSQQQSSNYCHSYQGFNISSSRGSSSSSGTSENYTDSYSYSKTIQYGTSWSQSKTITKEAIALLSPTDVMYGNTFSIQFVFYNKCRYPILSGKIRYYEDLEFEGEYEENVTI